MSTLLHTQLPFSGGGPAQMYPLTCLQNALFQSPFGYICMHFSIGSPCAKIAFAGGPFSYSVHIFGTEYICYMILSINISNIIVK